MPTGLWLYSYLALWGLLLIVCLLLAGILRQVAQLHSHWVVNDPAWGLPLGALAPVLPPADIRQRPLSLGAGRGRQTMLLFVSRNCSSCRLVMQRLPTIDRLEGVDVVLIVTANELQTKLHVAAYRGEENFPNTMVLADSEQDLMEQYKVAAVPYTVVVDEDGRIGAKGAGFTLGEMGALLSQAKALRERRLSRNGLIQVPPVGVGPQARSAGR